MCRLFALFFLVVFIGGASVARSAELDIPGLSDDSSKYADSLIAKFPTGGTPAQRRLAEQKAADGERKRDWAGAVSAWEARIGLGDAAADAWMSLAQDAMRETPPDAQHALLAAYQAFDLADNAKAETAPLLMTAFGNPFFNSDVTQPMDALPLRIFNFVESPFQAQVNQAYAGSLVLIVLIVLTSFAIRWATGGFRHGKR